MSSDNAPRRPLVERLDAAHARYWPGFEQNESIFGEAAAELRKLHPYPEHPGEDCPCPTCEARREKPSAIDWRREVEVLVDAFRHEDIGSTVAFNAWENARLLLLRNRQ